MPLLPFSDFVVIRPDDDSNSSNKSTYCPDLGQPAITGKNSVALRGTVVSIPPHCGIFAPEDVVFFLPLIETEIRHEGTVFYLVRVGNVVCKVVSDAQTVRDQGGIRG